MAVSNSKSIITTKKFYVTLAQASSILFPQYPCYYFPSFLLIQIYKRFKNKGYRLYPAPKKLATILTSNESVRADHYCFIAESVYDELIKVKDLNWINLVFGKASETKNETANVQDENIVDTILNKPSVSVVVPVISMPQCEPHCVFVNENCYQNYCMKYKLCEKEPIYVHLETLVENQTVPVIASRARIILIKNAYDLNYDIVDEIIGKYFSEPRLLHRNHTYEISKEDVNLDRNITARYHGILSQWKSIYFRCLHLESVNNPYEMSAIVFKGATNLHQATSLNYCVPKQQLDDLCCISVLPWGLRQSFYELKSSIMPFVDSVSLNAPVEQFSKQQSTKDTTKENKLLSIGIHPLFLVQGDTGSGRGQVIRAVAQSIGFQHYQISCGDIVSHIAHQTKSKLKIALAKVETCGPIVVSINNFELFGVDNEGRGDERILAVFQNEINSLFSSSRAHPLILVAKTSDKIVSPIIQRQFLDVIRIQPPTEQQRYENLQWILYKEIISEEIFNKKCIDKVPLLGRPQSMAHVNKFLNMYFSNAKPKEVLQSIAQKSKGFLYGDLRLLCENWLSETLMETTLDRGLNLQEIEKILTAMHKEFSKSLGAPKVPKVLWSDIGGLIKLKDEIQSSIGLPLQHMHLMGRNIRRSGILLYGPPGTGKTLVAKAVATECNLSFLSVQGPELLNMYVGQSEQNVREVFARARAAAPCVVFLDELDSLAPNRGHSGDSGGVMDRVVSQLLAEMDGMTSSGEPQKPIFILAATNRPDLIDPALLRPGRFDKLLYVGPYKEIADQVSVLKAQTKRFEMEKTYKMEDVAALLKHEMTGADLYSVCSNAWLHALRRTIEENNLAGPENECKNVRVKFVDFKSAVKDFVPSISEEDQRYFKQLKESFGR